MILYWERSQLVIIELQLSTAYCVVLAWKYFLFLNFEIKILSSNSGPRCVAVWPSQCPSVTPVKMFALRH